MVTKINVGELRRVIKESQNEFKPVVFGSDESKKINDKAYSDVKKETEKYDGGLTKKSQKVGGGINATDNKGMHDLTYDNISKPFKDRVKSQMKGYVSKDAETKHKGEPFGNATFDDEGKIYNAAKDHAEAVQDARQGRAHGDPGWLPDEPHVFPGGRPQRNRRKEGSRLKAKAA